MQLLILLALLSNVHAATLMRKIPRIEITRDAHAASQSLRRNCRQAIPQKIGTMKWGNKMNAPLEAVDHIVQKSIPGDVVEAGVAEGGGVLPVIFYLACTGDLSERKVHLFDTWNGLQPTGNTEDTGFSQGEFHKTFAAFNANVDHWKKLYDDFASQPGSVAVIRTWEEAWGHVNIVKGFFADTMPSALKERKLSFLMCDGDMYSSTKDCMSSAAERVSKGGIIYNDDYYSFKGCYDAVKDYLKEAPLVGKMYVVPSTGTFQYMEEEKDHCIPPVTNTVMHGGKCDGRETEASVFYVE